MVIWPIVKQRRQCGKPADTPRARDYPRSNIELVTLSERGTRVLLTLGG